jgi:hypothetical protein
MMEFSYKHRHSVQHTVSYQIPYDTALWQRMGVSQHFRLDGTAIFSFSLNSFCLTVKSHDHNYVFLPFVTAIIIRCTIIYLWGTLLVAHLVEALCYMLEDSGFDSRCCHWNFHSHKPSSRTMALETQPLTEMSTRNNFWAVKAAGVAIAQVVQRLSTSWTVRWSITMRARFFAHV